jgi:hypothetical protein
MKQFIDLAKIIGICALAGVATGAGCVVGQRLGKEIEDAVQAGAYRLHNYMQARRSRKLATVHSIKGE